MDVFPNPKGPITNHTKPDLILWNHTRLFDLLESLAKLCLVCTWALAQEMDYGFVIDQVDRKPLASRHWPCHEARRARECRCQLGARALSGRVGTYAPSMPHHRTRHARRHRLNAAQRIPGRRHHQDGDPSAA